MDRLREKHKVPFLKKALPSRVILSYIFDYVIIVVLVVTFTIIDKIEPYKQHFSLQNYTLQYPYAVHERIPVSYLVVICCFAPAVIIAIYTLVIDGLFSHQRQTVSAGRIKKWSATYPLKERLWELNCGILGLGLAVGAAFTVTGTLKNAIGKPRPDVIDRCQPVRGSSDPPVFGLSDASICTQTDDAIMNDGFKSFPSGHSSVSFAGLFYLSIYLAGKLHILDSKGEVWKTFVALVPTLAASLVAGTRIMDARHHPFDVLSGAALGILVAWGSYRQYFPPVTEPWRKGRAYPIRSWGRDSHAPVQRDDHDDAEMIDGLRARLAAARGSWDEQRREREREAPEGEQDDNVFRLQIAASQRQRDRVAAMRRQQRRARSDGVWTESSEEDEEQQRRRDDIELQPTQGFSSQNPYSPVQERLGEDTAYRSQEYSGSAMGGTASGDMGMARM